MYRLVKFDTLALDYANQVDGIGSGELPTAYHILPGGGALDMLGNEQMYPGVTEIVKTVRLTAATEAALSDLYFGLRALTGKPYPLYRELVDGSQHWVYARMSLGAVRDYEQTKYNKIQDISLTFHVASATWKGTLVSAQTALVSSPTVFDQDIDTDAGRADVRSIIFTVRAGSAAITSIIIARTGGETLTFTGTIVAGNDLVIDTGAMQVLNNAVGAYDDLTLPPTADLGAWFVLEPDDNEITVTFVGGGTGSTIDLDFYEAWR